MLFCLGENVSAWYGSDWWSSKESGYCWWVTWEKNNFSSRKQIKLSQTTFTKHHALCSQEKVQRKVEMRYSQTCKLILGMMMFSRDLSERYCCLVSKSCLTLATPLTVALQAPLSMGFPRQEYWSGLPSPSPGDPPDPGIEPESSAWQVDSLLLTHLESLSER